MSNSSANCQNGSRALLKFLFEQAVDQKTARLKEYTLGAEALGKGGRFRSAHRRIVQRKLDQIDAVTKLDDLKVPPGNRLHAPAGDRKGWYAVRVNDQYRIVFRFVGADAFDVRCTDSH